MIPRRTASTAILTLGLAASTTARAQSTPETPVIPEPPAWRFAVEPAAWYVAPGGDLKMPGSVSTGNGQQIDLELLNVDSPRVSPFAEFRARRDRWNLSVSGFSTSTTDRVVASEFTGQLGTHAINEGEFFTAGFDLASLEAIVGYEAYPDFTGSKGRGLASTHLDVLAGLRAYDVSASFSSSSDRISNDEFFLEPIVGVRVTMDIGPTTSIDVQTTLGGFALGDTHSLSWDIISGFQWRPTENFGVQIGYRNLLLDLQSGNDPQAFDFFGAFAGLYAGAVIRF